MKRSSKDDYMRRETLMSQRADAISVLFAIENCLKLLDGFRGVILLRCFIKICHLILTL